MSKIRQQDFAAEESSLIKRLEHGLDVLERLEELLKNRPTWTYYPIPVCATSTGIAFPGGRILTNPYQVGDAIITVNYENDKPSTPTTQQLQIEQRAYIGLRCGYRTDIEFKGQFKSMNLWYNEGGGRIEIALADGTLDKIHVPNVGQPALIHLRYGSPIKMISIMSANEMFLIGFCAEV